MFGDFCPEALNLIYVPERLRTFSQVTFIAVYSSVIYSDAGSPEIVLDTGMILSFLQQQLITSTHEDLLVMHYIPAIYVI